MSRSGWAKSQLNHGAWATSLLSKKSCASTNGYNFWLSSRCSIQHQPFVKNHMFVISPTQKTFKVTKFKVHLDIICPRLPALNYRKIKEHATPSFMKPKVDHKVTSKDWSYVFQQKARISKGFI